MALTFGLSAMAFLGVAGLATEVGSWYLAHRHGQNAADAAASGGALVRAWGGTHAVIVTGATNVATRNGYTTGGTITVTINHPPTSGPNSGDQNAVEAIVAQVQSPQFARLFRITAETVTSRAVAKVEAVGNACVLALSGDKSGNSLWLTGNFTVNAPNCALASDYSGSSAIQVAGSSELDVQTLYSAGGCAGCSSSNVTEVYAYQSYQPPIANPFASLDTVSTWPAFPGSNCNNIPNADKTTGITTLVPSVTQGYCQDLKMTSGSTVVMTPGTYIFWESSISINGGSLTCQGCTDTNGVSIVLLGSTDAKVGGLDINAAATVTLSAGSTNATYPALDGVLFYRENLSGSICGDCGGSTEIHINGGAGTTLAGGFYFPGADVIYNGNSGSACTVIVGGTVTMNGNATLDQTNCANLGTGVPRTQTVALVE